ncbi:deoxyribodipyrimidine photo-lyase [Endozoicomonas sp. SESOKO1]|uniref:cryptochrome/photolyase family protein n=1 Tax=Endozoicomonas sp. SESOKO1 TaxID=2828742 RepID=UPI002147C5C5|nr:deoxyribodipyrimidine photo-lyase [Endozoicomonas sp. SESOKO1]
MVIIHWFRQDLRLSDNPSLFEAAGNGQVLPVFILDDYSAGQWAPGRASRWWLHHSLAALNDALKGRLLVLQGDARKVLPDVAAEYKADAVYWNRCYEPWRIQRDMQIKKSLQKAGLEVKSFNGSLLWEPMTVLKKDRTPYRVFTPYYRKGCLVSEPPREPLPVPSKIRGVATTSKSDINALGLLPAEGLVPVHNHDSACEAKQVRWDHNLHAYWCEQGRGVGEAAAKNKLQDFLDKGLNGYKEGRDFPARRSISQLSAHLHFGEVSPNQVWYASAAAVTDDNVETDLDCFHSELGWREFSYYLLYHFPALPEQNFQPKFDGFPWQDDPEKLRRWQKGLTGIPIVDAGMRELWQTGFMHNRVRMIVGSFLVKNLLQPWHHGEAWFWDCLVDADLSSNSASWQWVAGSGADAAPYFRIFNPVSQGQKFDPHGEYIRRYVPELSGLPNKYLFAPWEAGESSLYQAGVILGENYPTPVVSLKESRARALEAWQAVRSQK